MAESKSGGRESKPLPEKHVVIEYGERFSQEEMQRLKKGLYPRQMEDKWFIYYSDTDNCLHFVRSWTKTTIYILRFKEQGDFTIATDFSANRDPDQYRWTDDESDKKTLTFLITILLARNAPGLPCCSCCIS